jgi:hypothetical protein
MTSQEKAGRVFYDLGSHFGKVEVNCWRELRRGREEREN